MCISEGYLVELADNSSTNESHVYVTKRYYEQHRELEEFKTAKQVIKYRLADGNREKPLGECLVLMFFNV